MDSVKHWPGAFRVQAVRWPLLVLALAAVWGGFAVSALARSYPHKLAVGSCSSSDYHLAVGSNGATGAIVGLVTVNLRRSTPCRVRIRLTFAVQRHSRAAWLTQRSVKGNPAHAQLDVLLRPGKPVRRDWAWRDWCGTGGRFRFMVSAGQRSAMTLVSSPGCASDGTVPSTVRIFPLGAPKPAGCRPEPGSKVIASSPQAVITTRSFQELGTPFEAWYGCLKLVGRERLLTSATTEDGYYTTLTHVALASRFVALSFSFTDKYLDCTSTVDVYDLLRTSKPGQVYITPECSAPTGIDSLTLSSRGFSAWRVTSIPNGPSGPEMCGAAPCVVEQLYAHDDHGTRLIDSTPPGSGTSLANISVSGDLLRWTHDGTPHQTALS